MSAAIAGAGPAQGSIGGDSITYPANGSFPGSATANINEYMSTRGSGGWLTESIMPPQAASTGADISLFQWFSPDLTTGIVMTNDPPQVAEAPEGFNNLYTRNFVDGSFQLLTTAPPAFFPAFVGHFYLPAFAGGSSGLERVIFEAPDALTPDAPPFVTSLYEWTNGQLSLVGILPGGTPASGGSVAGSGAGTGAAPAVAGNLSHAISTDGTRIFWTSPEDGQIYVRENAITTAWVSKSQAAVPDPNGVKPALYWSAAATGSKAFFTSSSELTDDANTGVDGSSNPTDAGNDLYRYDADSGVLTDLSVDTNVADSAKGANVQGLVGTSDDGSYVYFVATGKLATGAVSGQPNLYVSHNGSTSFIAVLSESDSSAWQSTPSGKRARLTPDGRYLAFTSIAGLTGYDNTDLFTGELDSEVFLYDASSSELTCASCNPTGSRPSGPSAVSPQYGSLYPTRALLDDGSRLFFDSKDALVPGDTNGRQDVYEFGDGQTRLISSGRSSYDSEFVDAGATGNDAFFLSREGLAPVDQDDNVDMYDARVSGGLASQSLPAAAPVCRGEECRGDTGSAPVTRAPASSSLVGPASHHRRHRRPHRKKHHHKAKRHTNVNRGGSK